MYEEMLRAVGLLVWDNWCLTELFLLSITTFSEETEKMDLVSGSAEETEHEEFCFTKTRRRNNEKRNGFPREAVQCPSRKVVKNGLNVTLSSLI